MQAWMPRLQTNQWCHMTTRQMMQCGRGQLGIEIVSYWEWAKLIATALLISICTTTLGFSIWWFFK
jgi:hypothetical protein